MLALLFSSAVFQAKEQAPSAVPSNAAGWVLTALAEIQESVAASNWKEAQRLASRLPSNLLIVSWDDSAVPESAKGYFKAARDQAIEVWRKSYPELVIKLEPKGSLKISFTESLPPNPDSSGPAGAVHFTSLGAGEPSVEAVIAVYRGSEKRLSLPQDVAGEIAFAIGHALGGTRQVKPGSVMYRSEVSFIDAVRVTPAEVGLFRKFASFSEGVRVSVSQHRDPQVHPGKVQIDPLKFTPAPKTQGESMPISLMVSNQGKGILEFRAIPDCGCFILGPYKGSLKPGESTLVPIKINTIEFVGKLNKTLFIYSNDPEDPIRQIPLDTYVRPAYRFIDQFKDPVVYVGPSGAVVETVLAIAPGNEIKVNKVEAVGVSAVAQYEPWSGTVTDPDGVNPPTQMKGYLIKVLIAPGLAIGRMEVGLQIATDHPTFKRISYAVTLQSGIAAVPASIYFGTLGNTATRGSVVVTRPGRPFKIVKVESDTGFIKPFFEPFGGDATYRIVAEYTGKAPLGRFFANITVFTDDPSEPTFKVPIQGQVQ